jgi:hypothetical protein
MTRSQPRSSWTVLLATALVGGGAALGGALVLGGLRLLASDPGFLFAVLPIISACMMGAGSFLVAASLLLAGGLASRAPWARLRTLLLGGCLAVTGLFVMALYPLLGLGMVLYGVVLAWLMLTPGAAAELGPVVRGIQQPTVWGQTPGTGVWSPDPPQQGPWSPDPTTLPWFPRATVSGPRTPWWEVWRTALARGVPLWEALVVGALLLVFAVSLIATAVGSRNLGPLGVLAAILGVVPFELRMRQRAAGRR